MTQIIRSKNPLPKDKTAELVVHHLGTHPAEAVDLIQAITEQPRRAMNRLSGSLPVVFTLPRAAYSRDEPLVAKLRASDARFTLQTYALVCPREEVNDKHWCNPDCRVMPIVEQIT